MEYKLQAFNDGPVKPAGTGFVFAVLWVVMFLLYLPAAKAGFVTDFTGWLDQVKNQGFWDYVNRVHFEAHSLYQFTQLVTYVFYKLFGIHPWPWHLLFISLHVINATCMFLFCSRLLFDSGVVGGKVIALGGALFFCLSPYISEVIVWEPAFHFLLGLLLVMVILLSVQKFIHTDRKTYAWLALFVYLLSTFSLEVFYVTPWLVLSLAVFYHFAHGQDKKILGRASRYFFIPMMLLFILRLIAFRIAYGGWVSRIGTGAVTTIGIQSFGKPAKYLFHLLFLGRFLSDGTRMSVYAFCDSGKGLLLFYGLVITACTYIIIRFRRMGGKGGVASLLFIYMLVTLALLVPLWFSDMLLVIFDRYAYFTAGFFYMLVAVIISGITREWIRIGLITVYVLANLRFTVMVNRYWAKSSHTIYHLLTNLPDPGNKTLVLLNLPESLNGVPMIGSEKESEYKLMHNLLLPENQIKAKVYDGLSYNMLTPADGAHATVLNDSTVRITLNQWGTWWWYEGKGGYSYQNNDYKLNMIDGGHFYELTLKKPAQGYMLLYEVGDEWKAVDMGRKGVEQD